jgi:non-specific serine/threonine protein kinase
MSVARGIHREFDGEVRLIELGSLSDPALLSSRVAGVLGLKIDGDELAAEVVALAVADRKILLVIDNCEHAVDATAELVEAIVRWCPRAIVHNRIGGNRADLT